VGAYLRYFTFLSREDIQALDAVTAAHPEQRQAQRVLAREVTTLVHGAAEAERAERAAGVLFTAEIASLDPSTLAAALADAPHLAVSASELAAGLSIIDALVRTALASSRGEARRLLSSGGVSVNNQRVSEDRPLTLDDALHGRFIILRRGKTAQHVLVVSAR
jgi:tyrosyl-tRNA synthetase